MKVKELRAWLEAEEIDWNNGAGILLSVPFEEIEIKHVNFEDSFARATTSPLNVSFDGKYIYMDAV